MSAIADSIRFNFTCNVHDWAYFLKNLSVSGKTYFLHKIACGLGQEHWVVNIAINGIP